MSEGDKRNLQALFEEGYTARPPSQSFMNTLMRRRKKQVTRHRIVGVLTILAFVRLGTSQWNRIEPGAEEDIAWVAEVDSMYEEHEQYKDTLLHETDGLAELPAETIAFLQLIDTNEEE